jgi:hypothetical protein
MMHENGESGSLTKADDEENRASQLGNAEKKFAYSNSEGIVVFGFVVEGPYGQGGLFGEGPEAGIVPILQNLTSAIPLVNIGNGISILQTGNDMFGNKQAFMYAPFSIVTGVMPFLGPYGLQNMINGFILDKSVENATKPRH